MIIFFFAWLGPTAKIFSRGCFLYLADSGLVKIKVLKTGDGWEDQDGSFWEVVCYRSDIVYV